MTIDGGLSKGQAMGDSDTKQDLVDHASAPARPLDASQAWMRVSIAEAARMTAESMRIVARSKEIVLRAKRGERSRGQPAE